MRAAEAEHILRAMMRAQDLSLKRLTLDPAVDLMAEFFDRYPCADAQGNDGDGLAFANILMQRDRGTFFEVSLFRMFRAESCGAALPGCRLRLTLHYSSATYWALKERFGAASDDKYCWSRQNLEAFKNEIKSSRLFSEMAGLRPLSAKIAAEPVWGVL